jgi:eukaryotic-like serine/threonine-protein kinase
MGVVYLAREVALDRLVAIKLLPPALSVQAGLRERFLREARTAAQLSQPNIVAIHAVDQAGEFVYFVMAYIEGETLGERVRTRGPLPPGESARVLREIAWALAYAHAQGVIHRDLKPDNIILERATGRAVLMDFGIARRLETTGLTAGGELIGTPEYMSPEQATGDALDGRTDLYSLGIVGYFGLTGRLPFEGHSIPDVLVKQATVVPAPLAHHAPGTPRSLAQAVMRCLEKRPEARFPDAKGFADALSVSLDARREIPAPVRAFVKESLEIKASGCLYIFAALYAGPALFIPIFAGLGFGSVGAAVTLYLAYLALAFVVVPIGLHLHRIRRLVRAGYGIEDVLAGARSESDQRKEEIAVTVGREASRLELVATAGGWAGLAVSVLAVGSLLAGLVMFRSGVSMALLGAGGVVLWLVGLLSGRRRRDLMGERRIKYWSSKFGRWLFKIASKGLARAHGPGATHRPTEMAIAFAADDLYAGLPKPMRNALPELPAVLARLEQQARAVRARIEGLEQSLADVGSGVAPGAAADHRATLTADLVAARDTARAHLGETVAALETIRLDLLRLRAGVGSVDRITADLSAAGDIGAAVDRLLAASDEVDRELGGGG